jgi:hypothetical protein
MELDDPHDRHRSTARELQQVIQLRKDGAPFLAWRPPGESLRFLPLDPARTSVTVGRAGEADVSLGWDQAVSKVHAELRRLAAQWVIFDDGLSRNGTVVAGSRVGAHRRLHDEDRIVVGGTVLVFHSPVEDQHEAGEPTGTAVDGTMLDRSDLDKSEFSVLRELCAPLLRDQGDLEPSNRAIAERVFLSEEGVKRVLTRLYQKFDITEKPKRERLAKRAISTGMVHRRDVQ